MSYDPNDPRPMEIQIIRSAVRDVGDRRMKAGLYGHVPEARPKIFTIQTADQWLRQENEKPAPRMLFGNFWFEGELCILFADTNMGKSILAVQLGDSISSNEPVVPFELHDERAHVLYIDFELSSKQFELRNSGRLSGQAFARTFFRAEFNPLAIVPPDYKDYQHYLNYAIEHAVTETKATVLIIDNITCLRNGTERASEALPLMQHLKSIKTKFNLSILVLAHTPKRNPANPISRNDLQGSKMLINFADSAFAIGESQTKPGLRYLKQVKQRSTAELYGANNVCLCKLKTSSGSMRYVFDGYAHEHDHLRSRSRSQYERLYTRAGELKNKGWSQRQIADVAAEPARSAPLCRALGHGEERRRRSADRGTRRVPSPARRARRSAGVNPHGQCEHWEHSRRRHGGRRSSPTSHSPARR
ncbi:MAG: AAA family ATPase [Sphingobacteriales bacterium]|nr:MAG: AAA family ATPase [Sphingobacteriales bacterium]